MSFDRFMPAAGAQAELPFGEPDAGSVRARVSAAVDSINGRYARTVIGYGGCAPAGGYAGAKIAYGRIPALEDFQ